MSATATINHAARVLSSIRIDGRADTALRDYLSEHRGLSPVEKRGITRAVFAYFRWLRWLDAKGPAQRGIGQALELQERFDKDPKSIKPEALAARAVPDWIWNEMDFPPVADAASSGSRPPPSPLLPATSATAWLAQLQHEPALWLRARPGMAATLAKSLFACELAPPFPVSGSGFGVLGSETQNSGSNTQDSKPKTQNQIETDAVRFTGVQDLFKTGQFKSGEFEIQDLASQLVGHACAPEPGETWWDACAGEGGKTLHLCDLMQNKGVVWATDRHTGRLETLKRRAARAKLFNYRTAVWDGGARLPARTKFDGVLLDAPCSGLGTWQRNPHARWTTTPDDVHELAATQRILLDLAATALKPGGRLVYSVCTLTRTETTAMAGAFTTAHPELVPSPVFSGTSSTLPPSASSLILWPHQFNANGMFIAAWRKKQQDPWDRQVA